MSTAQEYADGLRKLARWIEDNPDVDRPPTTFPIYTSDTKENLGKVLRGLSPCKKVYEDTLFKLERSFGPIKLSYVFLRNSVCTPRVIGTKHVEARHIPERVIPSQFIPAHDEDVIEWDCEKGILEGGEE